MLHLKIHRHLQQVFLSWNFSMIWIASPPRKLHWHFSYRGRNCEATKWAESRICWNEQGNAEILKKQSKRTNWKFFSWGERSEARFLLEGWRVVKICSCNFFRIVLQLLLIRWCRRCWLDSDCLSGANEVQAPLFLQIFCFLRSLHFVLLQFFPVMLNDLQV